jgi:hypothetical protein
MTQEKLDKAQTHTLIFPHPYSFLINIEFNTMKIDEILTYMINFLQTFDIQQQRQQPSSNNISNNANLPWYSPATTESKAVQDHLQAIMDIITKQALLVYGL